MLLLSFSSLHSSTSNNNDKAPSLSKKREKRTKTLNRHRGQGIKKTDDFFSRRKKRIPRRILIMSEKKEDAEEGSITSSELERVITDRDYAFLKTQCGGPHALAELLESNPKSGLTRVFKNA